jgi:type IV pilus assembly protein PilC
MKTFLAHVFDQEGVSSKVRLQGETHESVCRYLHDQGYSLQTVVEEESKTLWERLKDIEFGQKIKPQSKIRLLKTLGQMIGRGYALEKVIEFLLADEREKDVRRVLESLHSKTQRGYKDYEELFRVEEQCFDEEFFSVLVAGQKTGTVGENIVDYALGKSQMHAQKKLLIQTLSGKFVLLAIVFMAFLVIVLFVVPQFQDLFGDKLDLPIGMQIMMALSALFQEYGWFLLLGSGIFFGSLISLYHLHDRARFWIQHALLKSPVLGYLLRMMQTRNFLYMMGNLLSKGVSLMEAMQIVVSQSSNLCFRSVYAAIQQNFERGRKLEDILRPFSAEVSDLSHFTVVPSGYLLDSVAQALSLGSKGGNLGEMLTEAYQSYDIQLQNRMSLVIRIIGLSISVVTYLVIVFMIGSLAMTLFQVMEDPTAFV